MVHVPKARPVTVSPETAQIVGVVLPNVTKFPDAPPLAVTVVTLPTASVFEEKPIKPMICSAPPIDGEPSNCVSRTNLKLPPL